MLSPYLAIGSALADDRVEGVPELAKHLSAAAATRTGERGVEAIAAGATPLASDALEPARASFKVVSDGLIEYMRAHPETQQGHMLVHCPMTFEGSGALWVQKKGKVDNPYEGSRMPTCGSVVGWNDPAPAG